MREASKAKLDKYKNSFLLAVLSSKAVVDLSDADWNDALQTVRYGNVMYGISEILHEIDTLNMAEFIAVTDCQEYTSHLVLFAQYYDTVKDYAFRTNQLDKFQNEPWYEYCTVLRNSIKNSYDTFSPSLKDESTLRSRDITYNYLKITKAFIGNRYETSVSDSTLMTFCGSMEEFFHITLK